MSERESRDDESKMPRSSVSAASELLTIQPLSSYDFYGVFGPLLPCPPSRLSLTWTWRRWTWIVSTLGAVFIGDIVRAMQVSLLSKYISDLIMTSLFSLFGITTMQVFIYFKRSPQDRWPFKLLVRKTLSFHLKIFMLKISKDWLSVVRFLLIPLLLFHSETDVTNF